jgi:hypothetical protein
MNATAPLPRIVFEDAIRWQVECLEPGCTNTITIGKRVGRPRFVRNAQGRIVGDDCVDWESFATLAERIAAGDAATRCTLHPPTRVTTTTEGR